MSKAFLLPQGMNVWVSYVISCYLLDVIPDTFRPFPLGSFLLDCGLRSNSVAECLPGRHETPGPMPNTVKQQMKNSISI